MLAPARRRQLLHVATCGLALMASLAWLNPASAAPAQSVLGGLSGPVDFALLPDGSIWWIGYYSGNVTRHDANGQDQIMYHVTPVVGGERGLVGLGVNQASADNGTFYLYYAVAPPGDTTGGINHLSRIDHGQETLLFTTTAAVRHNGGRILIMDDGTLFVSTGENDLGAPAQDVDSLLGKILHILPDGSAAPGNPHGRMWSFGHRNVYGLAYDKVSKRLFATENSNAERDEVNEILPGHNYGWPNCEGKVRFNYVTQDNQNPTDQPCDNPAYTLPLGEFFPTTTAAPTGAAILDGHLYWASWNQGAIHRLDQATNGTWSDRVVYQYGGRINDLEAGLDGHSLYYSNWTDIVRIEMPTPDTPRLSAAGQPPATGTVVSTSGNTSSRGAPAISAALGLVAVAAVAIARRRRAA